MPVQATLSRSYDQIVAHGPGAYLITASAIWVFLPGLPRPLRMNIADPSVRPHYTIARDEYGRVSEVLDLIEAQGMVWRWQDGHISRAR